MESALYFLYHTDTIIPRQIVYLLSHLPKIKISKPSNNVCCHSYVPFPAACRLVYAIRVTHVFPFKKYQSNKAPETKCKRQSLCLTNHPGKQGASGSVLRLSVVTPMWLCWQTGHCWRCTGVEPPCQPWLLSSGLSHRVLPSEVAPPGFLRWGAQIHSRRCFVSSGF